MWSTFFMIAALVFFVGAAAPLPVKISIDVRVRLVGAGLACLTLSQLISRGLP